MGTYTSILDKGYSPTDALGLVPSQQMCSMYFITQCNVVISAWRCFALIIRNPGDNHVLRTLAHLVRTPKGVLGTPAGSPWDLRSQAGGRARPPGGVKIIPPG